MWATASSESRLLKNLGNCFKESRLLKECGRLLLVSLDH